MTNNRSLIRIGFLWCILLLLVHLPARSQQVSKVEYYIDTDPGIGQGTPVPVTPGTDITVSFQINISTAAVGFHKLYVRAYTAPYQVTEFGKTTTHGGWSLTTIKTFYKASLAVGSSIPVNVIKGEYFFDTDPGFNNGTNIPLTPGPEINNLSFTTDVTAITNGFHNMYARFKDANGAWSIPVVRNFYKQVFATSPQAPNIIKGEYFIDADPGFGAGINIPVTPGNDLTNVTFVADITAMTNGFHKLSARFMDANLLWGHAVVRTLYKQSLAAGNNVPPNVIGGEYYFDADPGFGRGMSIAVTPATDINNLAFITDVTSLSKGFHRLYTRFRDANGHWGLTHVKMIYKEDIGSGEALSNIVKAEYYIDTDPGFGNGHAIPLTPGVDINPLTFIVDMTQVSIGNHRVYVRALDANGKWSLTNTRTFSVEAPTELYTTLGPINDSICAGTVVRIPFTVNAPFGSNNIFTAQLSNSSGSFSNPTVIGTLNSNKSDTINATIPANFQGTGFRIRILASSPFDTSNISQPVTIRQVPQIGFGIQGANTTCMGSQTYTTGITTPGLIYTWTLTGGGTLQPNGASATVEWTTPGQYNLTLTISNECGNGTTRTLQVWAFNAPPAGVPNIYASGNSSLWSSATPGANAGVTGYQWYRNGAAIPGATNYYYSLGGVAGTYTLKYTNPCGEGPESNSITFNGVGQIQTVTFDPVIDHTFGDQPFVVRAVASSSLPVTYSIISGPATISNDTLTITGAGTVRIRAHQAGNDVYGPASVDITFVVAKAVGTVTLSSLTHTYDGTSKRPDAVTTPAGLPVRYLFDGSSTAPVNAGRYGVNGSIFSNNYEGEANDTLVIEKATQLISLERTTDKQYGSGSFNIGAVTSSGLPVTLDIITNPAGIASLAGNTITISGLGTVIITARQAGNENYLAATDVADTFDIIKANQLISFSPIATPSVIDPPFNINALSTSSLPLTYSIQTVPANGVATLQGNTITLGGTIGTVTVTATQAGNEWYLPVTATTSFQVLAAPRQSQTITFEPLSSNKTFGDSAFRLQATASSGLPVQFGLITGPVVLKNDTVIITGAGIVTIEAYHPGNEMYNPASARQTFTVNKAIQTIAFAPINDAAAGTVVTINAQSSALLPLTYSIQEGFGTLQGNHLKITGAGPIRVRAAQAGTSNYHPASEEITFCALPAATDTVYGFRSVCIGSQTYRVPAVAGTTYEWQLSGGGTLSATTGTSVSVNWTTLGSYTLTVVSKAACGNSDGTSVTVQVIDPVTPGAITNIIPANNTTIQKIPITISWAPATNALVYDLYIWGSGDPVPAEPSQKDLTQIGYIIDQHLLPGLAPGKVYNWKVVARNSCRSTESAVMSFSISDLPNLIVQDALLPASAFSGRSIDVALQVKNAGNAGTGEITWYDKVFISADTVFNPSIDDLVGGKANVSTLQPGEAYLNTISVQLPENLIGTYYLFVQTDGYTQVSELNETDNMTFRPLVINLTPPPDLQVTSVVTVGDAFSADDIQVTFKVQNKGAGATKPDSKWRDVVYLSTEQVLDSANAIQVGVAHKTGPLLPDSSYTQQIAVRLPSQVFGKHYLHVATDAGRQVYEFTFENNNVRASDSLTIFLKPTPDFIVTDINAPDTIGQQEYLNVSWTVLNQGPNKPVEKEAIWADGVFISKDPVFNNRAVRLGNGVPPWERKPECFASASGGSGFCIPGIFQILMPDEIYSTAGSWKIPEEFYGTCYIYVITDLGNTVFEYQHDDNNVLRKQIEVVRPDMIVSNVTVPATAASGNTIDVTWTIKNEGLTQVPAIQRQDDIYLSRQPVLDVSKSIRAGVLSHTGTIDRGIAITKQQSIKLPDSLSGTYYVFVRADHTNAIYESNENNNIATPATIQVTASPYPDLIVSEVTLGSDILTSGQYLGINYKVSNGGAADLVGKAWRDRIYISTEPQWDPAKAKLVKETERVQSVLKNASYEVQDSVLLNMQLFADLQNYIANLYFFVFTDAHDAIYEAGSEANNIRASNTVVAMQQWPADLSVTQVDAAGSVGSGKLSSVSWTVKNLSNVTGYYYGYWYDGIFISKDTVWDAQDKFITDKIIYGPLQKDSSYSTQLEFKIPDGFSGTYYLLLVSDHTDLQKDRVRHNNYKIIRDVNGVVKPLEVTLTPPPDLVVTSVTAPSVSNASQPVNLQWSVKNNGVGTALTGWTDRFYLSRDAVLDDNDVLLGQAAHRGNLAPGASYSDSLMTKIPATALGNYFLLLKTDVNDVIYEHEGEGNNTTVAGNLFITQAEPSDLIVKNVIMPAEVITGDSVTVQWTLANIGENPASGEFAEGIYLSRDSLWSNDDVLIANPVSGIRLAPLAELNRSARFKVKGITPGTYYVITRADLLNDFPESDELNNAGIGTESVAVTVKQLPVSILTADVLKKDDELYYRLDIPDSLAGETVMVTLKGDSITGVNELYVRYDSMPTRVVHDLAYPNAMSGNQDIIIPVAQKGTYYILAYGASPVNGAQDVKLLARKINFEVQQVAAKEGGNTGTVTVKIRGAKFEDGMTVQLNDATLGVVTATSVKVINSTSLFATFNLQGARLGVYDVRISKPNGQNASLADGFTVVAGSGGGLSGGSSGGGFYCNVVNVGVEQLLGVDVQYPASTRTRRVFPMTINFGNSGNVDIPIPTRMLVSMAGTPVSFLSETIIDNLQELLIEFKEQGGPDNVLRPGATGSITIYTQALTVSAGLRFRLIE
ncbi:MAG: hypothetical protein J7621_08480 [Niastella sp.]|nr:hypothetical protein [Niastella sp.]